MSNSTNQESGLRKWPETYNDYRLYSHDEGNAFYCSQMGEFAFYQAIKLTILEVRGDKELSLVQVEFLSGNAWGTKPKADQPETFTWIRTHAKYCLNPGSFFNGKFMSDKQVEQWEQAAIKSLASKRTLPVQMELFK